MAATCGALYFMFLAPSPPPPPRHNLGSDAVYDRDLSKLSLSSSLLSPQFIQNSVVLPWLLALPDLKLLPRHDTKAKETQKNWQRK